jgi:hypothetical protein
MAIEHRLLEGAQPLARPCAQRRQVDTVRFHDGAGGFVPHVAHEAGQRRCITGRGVDQRIEMHADVDLLMVDVHVEACPPSG